MEVETLVPESLRAGAEGIAEESVQRAPMVEETRVLAPGEAQDVGVVAAMMASTVSAQAATNIAILVVQLPDSSGEYGDSRDIDPAAAASAEASTQMASRPQPAPRVTPLDQASRGVGVPQARRSGTGKRSMSAR